MAVTGKNDVLLMYRRIVSELQGQKMWCHLTPAEEQRLAFYQELIATYGQHSDTGAHPCPPPSASPPAGPDSLENDQPMTGKTED